MQQDWEDVRVGNRDHGEQDLNRANHREKSTCIYIFICTVD